MDCEEIQLAGLIEESIVDGPGLRFVLFTQGCPHHCNGCHNPETHPYTGGTLYTVDSLITKYKANPLLEGMTFSGGEPFVHAHALAVLAKAVHALGGNIVTYTGYTYEVLQESIRDSKHKDWQELLNQTDVLIDGPYIAALRDLTLLFRGSSNQRILDISNRAAIDAKCQKQSW